MLKSVSSDEINTDAVHAIPSRSPQTSIYQEPQDNQMHRSARNLQNTIIKQNVISTAAISVNQNHGDLF